MYNISCHKVDRYFGIVKDPYGRYKMGDKIVHVDGGDIIDQKKRYRVIGAKETQYDRNYVPTEWDSGKY